VITMPNDDEMKARAEELRKEIAESISKRIKRLSDEDKKRVGDEIKRVIEKAREEYNRSKSR
jgi:gas vesicle protein